MDTNTLDSIEDKALDTEELEDPVLTALKETAENRESDKGPQTLKVMIAGEEKEISLADLPDLIQRAEKAKEIEAGSTKKFMEAAEIRKTVEPWLQIHEAWKTGDPTAQAQVKEFLGIKEAAPAMDEATLTTEEKTLYRLLQKQNAELESLRSIVKTAEPALRSTLEFTESIKAERQDKLHAAEIKSKFGIELTPEQVGDWRQKGISDPIQALELFAPMIKAAKQVGEKTGVKKQDAEIPAKGSTNVFDDTNMSADQLLRELMKGNRPI